MPLTEQQKSEIRRHLKYPNHGFAANSAVGGGSLGISGPGFITNSQFGILEQRLNSLAPCDEAALIGCALGSISLVGNPPSEGNQLTIIFSNLDGESGPLVSSPYSKTFTSEYASRAEFAYQVAQEITKDVTLANAGFRSLAPYGPNFNVNNPNIEIGILNAKTFNIVASTTGAFAASVVNKGNTLPEPSVEVGKVAGVPVIKYGFLPILNYLYGAIGTATRRQGTVKADVFTARQDEVQARAGLFEIYRQDLATFLDVPLNKDAKGGKVSYGRIVR